MEAFKGREQEKLNYLRTFHIIALNEDWSIDGVGLGDEKVLLQQFYRVGRVFRSLSKLAQEVIADICKRMGEGMALYAGRNLLEGTHDMKDYNMYCHYVAGLVGEGLSKLFTRSGYESA